MERTISAIMMYKKWKNGGVCPKNIRFTLTNCDDAGMMIMEKNGGNKIYG